MLGRRRGQAPTPSDVQASPAVLAPQSSHRLLPRHVADVTHAVAADGSALLTVVRINRVQGGDWLVVRPPARGSVTALLCDVRGGLLVIPPSQETVKPSAHGDSVRERSVLASVPRRAGRTSFPGPRRRS